MDSARTTTPPWKLLAQAIGGPREARAKLASLGRIVLAYARGRVARQRLRRLHELGIVEDVPTPIQIATGSVDMLRFFITPAARDYYKGLGINFTFHQLLRFVQDPRSVTDPVGFFSERDGIIGHLMQVVHINPCYDVQLLSMFDDGPGELERQLGQMLDGTHPRHKSLSAIVEDPGYHARLRDYVRAFRENPASPPPLRDNVAGNPRFADVEETFGTLTRAMRYFCRLPKTPLAAARHLATVRAFPVELAR